MKLQERETCRGCGAQDVVHINGAPHGNHIKSRRHQHALRAAEAARSDATPNSMIVGAASNQAGHAS
jgi:hypothetical protein